jgi:hypothetical protein
MIPCTSDLSQALTARYAPLIRHTSDYLRLRRIECAMDGEGEVRWQVRFRDDQVMSFTVRPTKIRKTGFYEDWSGVLRFKGAYLRVDPVSGQALTEYFKD